MRVAIIGSRNFPDKKRLYFELDELKKIYRDKLVIVTGCDIDEKTLGAMQGADQFAAQWAVDRKLNENQFIGFPANWDDMTPPVVKKKGPYGEYNALAGFKRNQQIIDNCDQVLAFWDGNSPGTEDSLDKAEAAKKKVRIIKFRI